MEDDNYIDDYDDFMEDDYEEDWNGYDDIEENEEKYDNYRKMDGYGEIQSLTDYLNSTDGVIELLTHANSRNQFNYILSCISDINVVNDKLINFLKDNNYSYEDYTTEEIPNVNKLYNIPKLFNLIEDKLDEDKMKNILEKINFVDQHIIDLLTNRTDMKEIISNNVNLKSSRQLLDALINKMKNHDSQVDFDMLFNFNIDYDADLIRKIVDLGFDFNNELPEKMILNNEFMKEKFLQSIDYNNEEILENIDKEVKDLDYGYYKLYSIKNKKIFTDNFVNLVGNKNFFQILKYIELSDIEIDLDSLIENNLISKVLLIYNKLNDDNELFDANLFKKVAYKTSFNSDIFNNIEPNEIISKAPQIELYINDLDYIKLNDKSELLNYSNLLSRRYFYKLEKSTDSNETRKIIYQMLTNMNCYDLEKLIIESSNVDKLYRLKASLPDNIKNNVDPYIFLFSFIDKINKVDDTNILKLIGFTLNSELAKNNYKNQFNNLKENILNLYVDEINSNVTDFSKYATEKYYHASSNIEGNNKVLVCHIPENEKWQAFIHVMNAYKNTGVSNNLNDVKKSKFIGPAYQCCTGISDEYSRICMNYDSINSLKILYTQIPKNSLLKSSNRDTGIYSKANSKNVSTGLKGNHMPLRRTIRNTKTFGSETYNEYDFYREDLKPTGIAYMFDEPTQEEIDAAAFLNVPLVKIDDLSNDFAKDILSLKLYRCPDPVEDNFHRNKDTSYEDIKEEPIAQEYFEKVLYNFNKMIDDKKLDTRDFENVETVSNSDGKTEYYISVDGQKKLVSPLYSHIEKRDEGINFNISTPEDTKEKLFQYIYNDNQNYDNYIRLKYPDGNVYLSRFEEKVNMNNEFVNEIIDYLVLPEKDNINFSLFINNPYEVNIHNKLNQLVETDDEKYISFFKNYIELNNNISPYKLEKTLLNKKHNIESLLNNKNFTEVFNSDNKKSSLTI